MAHFRNTIAKLKKKENPTKDSYALLSVSLILNILNSIWIFVYLCLVYFIYYNVIQIHTFISQIIRFSYCVCTFSTVFFYPFDEWLEFSAVFWLLWMLWQWTGKNKYLLKASSVHRSCNSYEQDLKSMSTFLGVVMDNIFSLLKSYIFYFYYSGILVTDIKE